MNCRHCNQKIKKDTDFCCHGCDVAYHIVKELNLDNYYQISKSVYSTSPQQVISIENQLDYYPYIKTVSSTERPATHKIHLMVGHIQCGACVWLIENTLKLQPHATYARINMSTKRLTLEWTGDDKQIEGYIKIIENLGYKLIPFNADKMISNIKEHESYLLKCLFISALATISIMMLTFGVWAGNYTGEMGSQMRSLLHFFAAIIAVPSILYSGAPFYKNALHALAIKRLNMDVPISIGTLATLASSIYATFSGDVYTYFDAAASLLFFLLIGRFLDLKARNNALNFAQSLVLAQSTSLTIEDSNTLITVDISRARGGQIAYVAVGDKVPIDGKIISGKTIIDNSLITGESSPINVGEGDYINAGTLNLGNPVRILIDKIGDDTLLGEIIRLMENAEQKKSSYVILTDKISGYFTPFILLIALSTLGYWSGYVEFSKAVTIAISTLIITCPCALGLAIPAAQIVASTIMFKNGIYLKTADAMEKLSQINHVIFDKTGTLTYGHLNIENISDFNEKELHLISSIAAHSLHPIAKNLAKLSSKKLISLDVKEVQGFGLSTNYKGKEIKIGNAKFCNISESSAAAFSEVWYKNGSTLKRILLSDQLKVDANLLVNYFQNKLKMKCIIVSGDKKIVVSKIAKILGIKHFKSDHTPIEKYNYVEYLTNNQGYKTLMIGDGLNDSAALKNSYLSMSPTTGLEIAQSASDIVFSGDKLGPVILAHQTAINCQRIIKQNLFISAAYNAICIPLAVLGHVNPIIAAIAMSASSIIVVLNSMRLINKKHFHYYF